ncbi:MAG: hypothetical protein KF752_03640 [Pirellulaceae bacterium]|nr:hypothetical protein [Pirellulaceae bacterium]
MEAHPYGALSLLPPIVAIALAIATRRLVGSMLVGIFVGCLLTSGFRPLIALSDFWEVHLWNTLIDPGRLRVFSFTLLMGALIGVVTRCGGMRGLIALVAPWARTRRRGQLVAWFMGLVVFFDDYANTLLLGPTLRPIADRLRISREKLAYIVDSTAAPVAGLALVSTWVAVEIEYVRSGLANVDARLEPQAFTLFVYSIPYRYYICFSLLLVPLLALSGREMGPMLRAERGRLASDKIDSRHPQVASLETGALTSSWYNAVLPIGLTVMLVIYFIYRSGLNNAPPGSSLNEVLRVADNALALQYGAAGGLALAALLARVQRLLDGPGVFEAGVAGARVVAPAILILWCASTLSALTSNKSVSGQVSVAYEHQDHRLYTGDYLKSLLTVQPVQPATGGSASSPSEAPQPLKTEARFPVQLLPTVVFLMACVVAFCTGTSWGTMGILLPIVVPMAYALVGTLGTTDVLQHPLMLASIGSVLAGAIFGDHCSPISDTTVLSAQSCSCDLLAHVSTQMPYALWVAAINILLGTLPLGFGLNVWWTLLLQTLGIMGLLITFGRKVESTGETLAWDGNPQGP